MNPVKALDIQNNYKEISESVKGSIEFLRCINFEACKLEDVDAIYELFEILETIFGGIENFKDYKQFKSIMDIKELYKYDK